MRVLAISVWMTLLLATAYALFHISYRVEEMEGRLSGLNADIRAEQQALHVLAAEWSFRTRPDRLAQAAESLLPAYRPVRAEQIVGFEDLPRGPAQASPPSATAPAGEVLPVAARRPE